MNQKSQHLTRNQKQTAKIGLFSAIIILISAEAGIGIFFKNRSIFQANKINGTDVNGVGVLLSWVFASLVVLFVALAFVEIIAADKSNNNTGLGGWARRLCGNRVGRFVLITMPTFYFALKIVSASFMGGESILNIFNTSPIGPDGKYNMIKQPFVFILLIAIAIFFLFATINTFSLKTGRIISTTSTFLKFIPLILVGVMGIGFGIVKGINYVPEAATSSEIVWTSDINILGIFTCLPALLYAFDSFLIIGNVSSNMTNPNKDTPKAILIGIPFVAFIYLLVTIGELCTGKPDAYQAFHLIFRDWFNIRNAVALQAVNCIVATFIVLAVLGVVNSLCLTSIRAFQSVIDNETIFGAKFMQRITGNRAPFGGLIYLSIMVLFYFAIIGIPSSIMNNDQLVDGISNFPALFFFGVYAIVITYGLINHFTKKVPTKPMRGYSVIATIAIIGCVFALGYNLIYEYGFSMLVDKHGTRGLVSWGMFKSSGTLEYYGASLVFYIFFIWFILLAFINDGLIALTTRHQERKQQLIWE